MEILEKVNTLAIEDLSVIGTCNLFHYGKVVDCINHFNYEFTGGKVYGIIGEFGFGGAALTNCLTGIIPMHEGKIYYNGNNVSQMQISKKCCYVGDDVVKARYLKRHMTIKEQIEYGLRNIKSSSLNVNEIQNLFLISDERFTRRLKYVSGERWKASAAIGYANGRSIYCYPWLNTKDIEHLKEQISGTIEILKNAGAIIIVPTTKEENIYKISSDCEVIYL